MNYKIIKLYIGDIELNLSKKTIKLTDSNSNCIVAEDEYEEILSKYESLILSNLILVNRIEEKIKENKIEVKKFNK